MTYREYSISFAKKGLGPGLYFDYLKETLQIFECKTGCVNFEKKSGDVHDPRGKTKDFCISDTSSLNVKANRTQTIL